MEEEERDRKRKDCGSAGTTVRYTVGRWAGELWRKGKASHSAKQMKLTLRLFGQHQINKNEGVGEKGGERRGGERAVLPSQAYQTHQNLTAACRLLWGLGIVRRKTPLSHERTKGFFCLSNLRWGLPAPLPRCTP